jgi:hypothetical protein
MFGVIRGRGITCIAIRDITMDGITIAATITTTSALA